MRSPVMIFSWKNVEKARYDFTPVWILLVLRDLWNLSSSVAAPKRYFCFFSFCTSFFHRFLPHLVSPEMYDLSLFRKSILLVEFLDERKYVTFFVDILRYSEPDPRSPAESELTRYTSMYTTCNRCEERSQLLVISLSMDHDICVALVTRDHDLEY